MPGNPGVKWNGASSPTHPPGIMGKVADVSACRGQLRDAIPGIPGGDAGGPWIPHYIHCGGGWSGTKLGSGGGSKRRRAGRASTGGTTPNLPLLRVWRHGSVIRPGMAAEGFQHPSRAVCQSGKADKCQEDSWNGLLSLSGSGRPVIVGVR